MENLLYENIPLYDLVKECERRGLVKESRVCYALFRGLHTWKYRSWPRKTRNTVKVIRKCGGDKSSSTNSLEYS